MQRQEYSILSTALSLTSQAAALGPRLTSTHMMKPGPAQVKQMAACQAAQQAHKVALANPESFMAGLAEALSVDGVLQGVA